MRRIIIAGNWKMHKTRAEAVETIKALSLAADLRPDVDVLVCPAFTALDAAVAASVGTRIGISAQNIFWKEKGAYTSLISPSMLKDVGVTHVIIGHSETRGRFGVPEPDFDEEVMRLFGETDETVRRKTAAALDAELVPIVCVGETLSERQAGKTDSTVSGQVGAAFAGLSPDSIARIVIAYEPVWAIGTGQVCGADEADRVCGVVRAAVESASNPETAKLVRVQYGGSVKPDNAADLLSRPNIDGALVGGASLNANEFAWIIAAAPLN